MLSTLLSTAEKTVAEGAQLQAAIAATSASDDYDVLADAPRIAELCVATRDQLSGLVQEAAATGWQGCVTALRVVGGAKAATLRALAKLDAVAQLRTKIAFGHDELSRVLPPSSEATLLQFLGGTPVGHSSATCTAARQWVGDS